jgi:uroporphyrin-III C-methyltransferase
MKTGMVYLVGAGPGDPELLTLRALRLLKTVEVVAHDALISKAILNLIPKKTEKISVGHRGDGTVKPLHSIHPKVIESAQAGKSVVRLKSGDPMIFGRGGEEAIALSEAGLAFQIVPGVTAALGAASSVGIPLTHRLKSSDVTFATAHTSQGPMANLLDWASLPTRGTVVLYMVSHHLKENMKRLIEYGRSPDTPAAFVSGATLKTERVVIGPIKNLAKLVGPIDDEHASLVIVGEVVSVREKIKKFLKRP